MGDIANVKRLLQVQKDETPQIKNVCGINILHS